MKNNLFSTLNLASDLGWMFKDFGVNNNREILMFWHNFGTFFVKFPQCRFWDGFWSPFGSLLAPFGCSLAPVWLPLAPFWHPLTPVWLPLAPFWPPLARHWLIFGSFLGPSGYAWALFSHLCTLLALMLSSYDQCSLNFRENQFFDLFSYVFCFQESFPQGATLPCNFRRPFKG